MRRESIDTVIRQRFSDLVPLLNERDRRLWAATEAKSLGYGGIAAVGRVTGISRRAIHAGLRELNSLQCFGSPQRIRSRGGGRKPLVMMQPDLPDALEALVEPTARGDPESSLRWTCKGVRRLATELQEQGFQIERQKVADLLHELGYSLQANRKTREGSQHPDRNAQFAYIAAAVAAFQARALPVISVDTKKKELVGEFKNTGREWCRQGHPTRVRVHDFADPQLGKAIPYGIYDLTANLGWVSVGIDHDTAAFAVATIRRWWQKLGQPLYPHARELLITADGGGSNGSRSRLWKVSLQQLADELGVTIQVCHFPPGTSKWNKIEHRLFSQISTNWRGQPLTSHAVIIELIAHTTTTTGLRVQAELDTGCYPTGIRITRQQFATVNLFPAAFHGDWNYAICPSAAIA
jgi:Rhodopirellula transposase DDE domain